MQCPKCHNEVRRQGSDTTYWCTCGYHWPIPPRESDENDNRTALFSVEVPEDEEGYKTTTTGKNRPNRTFLFDTREKWLEQQGCNEFDVMYDDEGNEYIEREDETSGELLRVGVPVRYKGKGNISQQF